MLNIKKVRYVRSALGGAPLLSSNQPFDWAKAIQEYSLNYQIPINPYMTTDGFAYPKSPQMPLPNKPVGSIAKSTDVKTLNKNLPKIPTGTTPKQNFLQNPNTVGYLNQGLGLANDMLFSGEENSGLTNGINQGWDTAAGAVGAVNPLFGAIMKGVSLVGNSLKAFGGGTDQMTTADQVFDSAPGTVLTLGLNGFLGKNTQNFSANKQTIEQVGGSYGGSVKNINDAASKAGKKYGLFSSGSRKEVDKQIGTARGQQGTMTGIANEASDMFSIASNMSQLNHMNYGFNLSGGYDQRYMRAAKDGGKLDRIKKLNLSKFNTGGIIKGVINLETEWVPVITEPIEIYEDGGKIWMPEITEPIEQFQEGGIVKPKFEDWFKSLKFKDANYDYRRAYEEFDTELLLNHAKDPDNNHLFSVSSNIDIDGRIPFLKLGTIQDNPEIQGEFDWYNSKDGAEHKSKYDIVYDNDRYYYTPKKFEEGGKTKEQNDSEIKETSQKNVIPEGALHARKHHMENADGLTEKGIPVIDNDREQQAEIELNEIIFTLEVTKKLEELYKDGSDDAAIEAGKLLVEQILFNTDDRTGLISTLKQGGQLKNK